MANYELKDDDIVTIPVMGMDAGGDMVPLPAGTTPTVKCSDPGSLNAVISGTSLVLNALVPIAAGITVEVDDGSLQPFTMIVDIVADLTPTSVTLDLAAATHTPQLTPAAPPPPPPGP